VVGYNVGYGCSDESTLGEIVEPGIEDNTSRWSGNHLMAPEVVPGVLSDEPEAAADEGRPPRLDRDLARALRNRRAGDHDGQACSEMRSRCSATT
jgi:hypothetical protein